MADSLVATSREVGNDEPKALDSSRAGRERQVKKLCQDRLILRAPPRSARRVPFPRRFTPESPSHQTKHRKAVRTRVLDNINIESVDRFVRARGDNGQELAQRITVALLCVGGQISFAYNAGWLHLPGEKADSDTFVVSSSPLRRTLHFPSQNLRDEVTRLCSAEDERAADSSKQAYAWPHH